jgi:hypothetical protein
MLYYNITGVHLGLLEPVTAGPVAAVGTRAAVAA